MTQSHSTPPDVGAEHAVAESSPGVVAAPTRSPRRATKAARGCRCRVAWCDVRTLPVGGRYWGVLVCTRCSQPQKWLARPKPLSEAVEPPPPPPAWLITLAERHQGPPATLLGTERQRQWAEALRVEMKARHWDDPEMLRVLDTIINPNWFIRNRGDGTIVWPTRAEVAADPDPPPADGAATPGG